jgi:3-dehydrosphinganine reductase
MVFTDPMVGYTSYAPSKAAVRLFADCLRSELQGTGVTVSVGYPPDTATPGYDRENVHKPEETLAISRLLQDQVYPPEQVAKALFRGLKAGKYHLPSVELLHTFALSHTAGVTPRPMPFVLEFMLAPLLVGIGSIICYLQDWTVRNAAERRRAGRTVGSSNDMPTKER